ncbi:MAG: protoporphyrinogen oxidase HemJ [Alphaproteobacteria bacterium]
MSSFLAAAYPWIKALHIVAVIAWMAGMLYLPRLFAYHAAAAPGSETSELLKVMERRLLRVIINPAMVATFVLGGLLLVIVGPWGAGWMWAKLALALALGAMHGLFARWRRDFAADRNRHDARFYRRVNEVPTILMIAIVVLVVVKPF